MKYIWSIVAFLFILSLVDGYIYLSAPEKKTDALMTINKRVISKDEFNHHMSKLYSQDRKELINTLVTQELLIQEAQRLGIDKTDSFRKTIQDFYEQTLVKQTIDHKLQTTPVVISDNDIENHLAFQDKTLSLSFFSAENEEKAAQGQLKMLERKTVRGKDLSEEMGAQVQALKVGEKTLPIGSGADCIVIQLDKVEGGGGVPPLSAIEKEAIRKVLTERKKQNIVNSWVADLRKKAVISEKQN